MDISQVFPLYFKLHIALCYVFWLQEMSIKLTYNVLEENYQYLFHIGQKKERKINISLNIFFCVLQKTESLADKERQIWNMHSQVFVA